MIKWFCDLCGKELPDGRNYVSRRPIYEYNNVRVELTSSVDGTWNAGQLCGACIVDVVARGQDVSRD